MKPKMKTLHLNYERIDMLSEALECYIENLYYDDEEPEERIEARKFKKIIESEPKERGRNKRKYTFEEWEKMDQEAQKRINLKSKR